MAIHRFYTSCDHCTSRSEEYTSFPSCSSCGDDICPACTVPGTTTDADVDAPSTGLCLVCRDAEVDEAFSGCGGDPIMIEARQEELTRGEQ